MQIDDLTTESESLIKNRDGILENHSQRFQSYIEKKNIPKAFEEFRELFLLVAGLSGSLYVVNDFASDYMRKLDQMVVVLENSLEKSVNSSDKSYQSLSFSLEVSIIYLRYLELLVDKDDQVKRRQYLEQIELLKQQVLQNENSLNPEEALELQLILDFFKIGLPVSDSGFNTGYYQIRKDYVNAYYEYVQSKPAVFDKTSISNLCSNIGGILLEDQLEVGKEILEFGLELAQESQSPALLTRSLTMLGHYYRLKGQLDVALDNYQQSVRQENVPHLLFAYPIRHIGEILQTHGELDKARLYYEKSLKLFELVSNDLGVARTLQYIGNIHYLQAGFDEALDYYGESLQILKRHNYQRMIVDVLYSHIKVYLERSELELAQKIVNEIQKHQQERDHKGIDQVYRLSQALVYKMSRRRVKKARAQELLEQIVNEGILNHEHTIVAMQHLCELLVDEMRTEPAEEIFVEANLLVNRLLAIGQEQELYQVQIQALILQSQFDMVQGKFDETLVKLSEADVMCKERNLPQLTEYVLQFRERYLKEFSKWQSIVHDNETIQDRLANEEIQEYIKLTLAAVQEEKQQTETLLQTVLPVEIIPHLKDNTTEVYAERFERVSIIFADIVGFTSLSTKLAPHDMVMLLNEIFTKFDTLLAKYDVEKIRTIGDNYMAVVGAPRRNQTPSKMMAKFALEVSLYLRNNVDKLQGVKFRIGVNTGEVVGGVVGTDRYHFDVWGDAVNVAARMESHGIPDKIQVTEQVYNDLRDEFIFEERGFIEIKGKEPVKTWFLLGERT
ncbi:MAG: Adenylate cyclase [Candidatus Heimdallarchaeota archaeon LC_2]|nr:MAG: Adenylate cyclase [Candidatus Heimdallarchaeota archaeon LC_2]